MIVDCHVHLCALTPEHGQTAPKLLKSAAFRYMRRRFGLVGDGIEAEAGLASTLLEEIATAKILDAVVVLAFDAVHDDAGNIDLARTPLYVKNDYVIELAKRHPQVLFGASIHPYRPDAVQELERCVAAGAVLVKWLPIVQNMNPADLRCIPFYEAMAHYDIPLLCHTGGEKSLPQIDVSLADPGLLKPALRRGVKVIMAHCGTRSFPGEDDFVEDFVRLARAYEHCYGDTSALNLPTRSHAYKSILADEEIRSKLVHGSDWPIPPFAPLQVMSLPDASEAMFEHGWLARDILIKQKLGFDEAYWRRAAKVLRMGVASTDAAASQ